MNHPLLTNRKALIIYWFAWAVLAGVQALILNRFNGIVYLPALSYNGLYLSLLALVSIFMWYPVKFIYMSDPGLLSRGLNIFGLALVGLGVWELLAGKLVHLLLTEESLLMELHTAILPVRLLEGVFIQLIMALGYYLVFYYSELEDARIAEADHAARARESELKMLKYQLNPHFLFNSLNSINSLTVTNAGAARDMIVKLSDYLRYSLESDHEQFSKLKDEVENIGRYLDIERIRFGERIDYKENIQGDCYEIRIPSMLLQPLVENAIKHAVHESTEPVIIQLECRKHHDEAEICLDNMMVPGSGTQGGTGTGLKNIRQRLLSSYGEAARLVTSVEKDRFRVKVFIPLR